MLHTRLALSFHFILLAAIIFPWQVFSQTLSGRVMNERGQPIPDVLIYIQSDHRHTHSGAGGEYRMPVPDAGDTLVAVHLGYATWSAVCTGQTGMTIIMQSAPLQLEEIEVRPGVDHARLVARIDLETQPVRSAQEILRTVPGLTIGQHAGGGKAEQIFLRGFDVDHGTDVAIDLDGMPVNMVSHAHGQGYADLHFLIPETIDRINYGKGPYRADHGNFATAGHVGFVTRDILEASFVQLEGGSFGTVRAVSGINLVDQLTHNWYVASDMMLSQGPFEAPQRLHRYNIMTKYTAGMGNGGASLSLLASHFRSGWDASGQIPQRAVHHGMITRFGAIDDTEGGSTSRSNALIHHQQPLGDGLTIHNAVFLSRYDFDLYSNFTFFLNDPVHGDQIRQRESRLLYGGRSEVIWQLPGGDVEGYLKGGLGLRHDLSAENALSRSVNRDTEIAVIRSGDINELNVFGYVSGALLAGKLSIHPGIRLDHFRFVYHDKQDPASGRATVGRGVLSPSVRVFFDASPTLQYFFKTGVGFHSNDTRVVVARDGHEVLPRAFGADAGFVIKPGPRLLITTALWYLDLEQEFVYVGDEGIVELSGPTRRLGFDVGARWQPADWLYIHGDINYAHGRSRDAPQGETQIPLAPDWTSTGGVTVRLPSGVFGSFNYRWMDDRPATEDNAIIAEGYVVADATVGYTSDRYTLQVAARNVFNTEWNETQFATTSRLRSETEPVEEIHFTPGAPFGLQARLKVDF
ncbi:MAG: TonB-dependent receptor plug domain-containing protein [Saprospiraceae bacterium]|nr:TonB-dependent receptor plug domain-containing protein [Saprospiraceae bacterium]